MPADRLEGRVEMLDGFNSGWIDFEHADGNTERVRGDATMEEVFRRSVVPVERSA